MIDVSDQLLRTSGLSLIAAAYDDSDDAELAREAYESFARSLHEGGLQAYPRAFRGDLVFPLAIFVAEHYRDADAAQRWIDIGGKEVMEKYLRFYAEAACADARGDTEAASDIARKALRLLPDPSSNGVAISHGERLTRLARRT